VNEAEALARLMEDTCETQPLDPKKEKLAVIKTVEKKDKSHHMTTVKRDETIA
jgi:hypothetical protein